MLHHPTDAAQAPTTPPPSSGSGGRQDREPAVIVPGPAVPKPCRGSIDRPYPMFANVDLFLATRALLARRIEEEGWLDDAETNYLMGWGKGHDGRVRARKETAKMLDTEDSLAIVACDKPVGWIRLESVADRELRLEPFIAPLHRQSLYRVGPTALVQALDRTFEGRTFRVEVEVLMPNSRVCRVFRALGFRDEGRRFSRRWVGESPYDTLALSMTKPMWKHAKKRWQRRT